MPTANRNTEVSYGVSRGYHQKQILRVTIEQLPVPERSLIVQELFPLFIFRYSQSVI